MNNNTKDNVMDNNGGIIMDKNINKNIINFKLTDIRRDDNGICTQLFDYAISGSEKTLDFMHQFIGINWSNGKVDSCYMKSDEEIAKVISDEIALAKEYAIRYNWRIVFDRYKIEIDDNLLQSIAKAQKNGYYVFGFCRDYSNWQARTSSNGGNYGYWSEVVIAPEDDLNKVVWNNYTTSEFGFQYEKDYTDPFLVNGDICYPYYDGEEDSESFYAEKTYYLDTEEILEALEKKLLEYYEEVKLLVAEKFKKQKEQ